MFFRKKKAKPEAEAPAAAPAADPAAPGVPAAGGPASTQVLTGDQRTDRGTVQVLLDTIAKVSEVQDLDTLLVDIVDRSVELTGAERGILMMRGKDGGLKVRVARANKAPKGTKTRSLEASDLRFSTTISSRVGEDGQAVRATVHSESEALELGRSVYDLKLRAVMCVPLNAASREDGATDKRPSGVLYVDSRAATRQFSQRDLGLFAALAQHISIAVGNAVKAKMEHDMDLAKVIQSDLMPQIPKDIEGYDLHGWYRPAERAGGDFFDFLKTKGGGIGVAIGDATGHGIGPALITTSAQAGLRSYMKILDDRAAVVTHLNQDLCERVEDGRFLTMFLSVLSPDGQVESVNAGHEPPVIWRKADDSIEVLPRGGPALGMMEDIPYELQPEVRLESGDVLVIFTDGVTEMRDPQDLDQMFGDEGLHASLRAAASAGLSAEEIALKVVEDAMSLSRGEQDDDVTFVVVRKL